MTSRTVRFRELSLQASKNLPCPSCGKKVRRQRTFRQTLNPFNKNAAGEPKSAKEIYADLQKKVDEFEATPVRCTPCTEQDGDGRG